MAKPTTSVMDQVNAEVEQLWSPSTFKFTGLGDGSKRYRRCNIETWLLQWHMFSQEADYNLPWALVRADILQAISKAPQTVQDFFELYCVIGYNYDEIATIMNCKVSSCRRYWWKLRQTVIRVLCDDRIIAHPANKDLPCPISSLFAYSSEGQFDEPVLTDARKC